MTNPNTNDTEPFGPVIYSYTRAQAVADGEQVDVSKLAQEAGLIYPLFLTRAVHGAYVTVPPGVTGQDEAGRAWDIVWMLRCAIGSALHMTDLQDRLMFSLYVRNDDDRPRLVTLRATCDPLDIDDPQPAITVMLSDED